MMQPAHLSHVVLYCYDFERMFDFYTRVIGMRCSDQGTARGNRIAFLTFDPQADHHQLGIAGGRQGTPEGTALSHLAFRVPTMAALRDRHAHLLANQVAAVEPISHATWFSVYWRDPENNRLEFFWDAPYYVEQPVMEPLDLSLSDDAILADVVARHGKHPSFRTMAQWKAEQPKVPA